MPTPTKTKLSFSLPAAMAAEVERVRKAEHRTRSELVREALRTYFSRMPQQLPEERPSAADRRAMQQGLAALRRGDAVSLNTLLYELGYRPRRSRKAVA